MKNTIPTEKRPLLSLKEASEYFGINLAKLNRIANDPKCPYVLKNGKKNLIKREAMLEHLMNSKRI